MNIKTTPDEPGFPPRHGFAAFIGRGFWIGLITVLIIGLLTWLAIEWLNAY